MSRADSDDRPDELTERYRSASAADPALPAEAVRRSIMAHARTIAAREASGRVASAPDRPRAANDSRFRITAAASVIVAGLAGVLAWQFHSLTRGPAPRPNPASSASATYAQNGPLPANPSQPAELLRMDQGASTAPAPNAVTARSRQRTAAQAQTPRSAHDYVAGLEQKGLSPTNSKPSLASVTPPGGAQNAASGSPESDADARLEAGVASAKSAPAPAAPPVTVDARRSSTLGAASSARRSAPPESPLVTAAEAGDLERVDRLLRSGFGTEQTDAQGRTALLIATLRGDLPMVRRLLASGARTDAADEDGDTPLAAARRGGPPELVTLLERAAQP